ncbi:hypothetical protein TEA_022938 [Camellia sinensis var. sinensis]|uniref:Uncharacterized protein n=1 Tax=Camellia sinensis var. sinensis TaxID=542762 RepID=A0A4S4DKW7_CAMSN|nr:hypothetical protein TEA_022938 [Camellia sinensis var. sinensis]
MAENENLLPPKNRIDDDMIRDFPPDFKSYVKNHLLLYQSRGYGIGSVFSSCKRPPPPHLFSEKIIDRTLIAPPIPEFMKKIKSYFKIILFVWPDTQFLIQFWKVIEIEGKRLLTTRHQPFGFNGIHEGLCSYRLMSLVSEFDVDGLSKEHLGLHGRCGYIEDNVYMLEFFLPPNYIEGRDPWIALVLLLTTMRQHCKSFKVASGEELGEELSIKVLDFTEDGKLYSFPIPQTARTPNRMDNREEMVWLDAGIPISLEEDGKLDSFKKPPNCKISK